LDRYLEKTVGVTREQRDAVIKALVA